MDELIAGFSVGRISKSPAIFDLKKLQVLNGRHLRLMPSDEFDEALVGWLRDTGYLAERGPGAEELVRASAPLVKRKISTFADYDALAGWLFEPLEIEPEAWEVLTRDVKHSIQVIGGGLGRLESLPEFTAEAVKDALQDQLHVMGEAARDFLEPQRIAVTGRLVSTGTYESLALLGRDEAFARYRATLGRLAELWAPRLMFAPGTQRTLMLTAAWLFGAFLVVAFVFRRIDASQETLSVIAGVTAYVFLVAAAFILYRGWRRQSRDAAVAAVRFVEGHPAVPLAVGRPVEVGHPEGEVPSGKGPAQANLVVPVSGPADDGQVDLVMARMARSWEVLSATLVVDGDRVSARGGACGHLGRRGLGGDGGRFKHGPARGPGGPVGGDARPPSRHRLAHGGARGDGLVRPAHRGGARPRARGGARAQPRRGDRARGDEPRVAPPHGPGARQAPAPVPLHRPARSSRLEEAEEGGGRARAGRRRRPRHRQPARRGRRHEPPPPRARADHRTPPGSEIDGEARRALRHFLSGRASSSTSPARTAGSARPRPRPRHRPARRARPTASRAACAWCSR